MNTQALRLLRRQALFGWLNFVLAVPSIYLLLGMPLVMRQHGWSGTEIGLFQLAGLPAVFKFFLALPVERWRFAGAHYRSWALLLCLGLAAVLLLVGRQELLERRALFFVLTLLAGVLATWADIPVNALAIKLLPESERVRAGAIRSAALFMAAIVGGGLMLLVHECWGWQAPFALMSVTLLLGALALPLLGEGAVQVRQSEAKRDCGPSWRGYFEQPGAVLWTCLLLSCFPFIGASWLYLKPLLLDQGMPATQVAWVAGVGGGVIGALASVAGGFLLRRLGVARALPLFTGFALFALASLSGVVWSEAGTLGLVIGASLVAAAMGAISAMVFGLMMFFTRQQRQAVDYGLQASLFVVSRLAVPVAAGVLLDHLGYTGMLLCLTSAMLGVCALAVVAGPALARITERNRGTAVHCTANMARAPRSNSR
ncbi:MFS transporter [Ectopseudomonas alcaliphila]|uniref:MFS transporter n=1 Tax=Ectopseudomonas alcaliphila TaxID=101564 RepID=A0A1G6VEW1_9GAMM|nr:MFS transporter [Pseudomonas alcaliphila]MDX5991782.1 MFS transporter [Pseudomonas alcaliphila]SDD52172.1 Major Facilitator Superfamily protein [Pseudomonas alcaliphila]